MRFSPAVRDCVYELTMQVIYDYRLNASIRQKSGLHTLRVNYSIRIITLKS